MYKFEQKKVKLTNKNCKSKFWKKCKWITSQDMLIARTPCAIFSVELEKKDLSDLTLRWHVGLLILLATYILKFFELCLVEFIKVISLLYYGEIKMCVGQLNWAFWRLHVLFLSLHSVHILLPYTYTKHSFDASASNTAMARPFVAKCLPLTKVETEKLCKNIYQLLCYLFSFFATVNFVARLFVYYGFYNLFLVSE